MGTRRALDQHRFSSYSARHLQYHTLHTSTVVQPYLAHMPCRNTYLRCNRCLGNPRLGTRRQNCHCCHSSHTLSCCKSLVKSPLGDVRYSYYVLCGFIFTVSLVVNRNGARYNVLPSELRAHKRPSTRIFRRRLRHHNGASQTQTGLYVPQITPLDRPKPTRPTTTAVQLVPRVNTRHLERSARNSTLPSLTN